MATIRDLKTPFDALSDSERFELVREIRHLRRMLRPKKEPKPRASPSKKQPKKLSLTDITKSLSQDDTAKLIARLQAQLKGAPNA